MYTDPSDEDTQVVVEEIVETTESQIHVVKFFDHSDQDTLMKLRNELNVRS